MGRLDLFRNEMCAHVLHGFVKFKHNVREQGDEDEEHGLIFWLEQMNAWIAITEMCLTATHPKGGHLKNIYADTFQKMVKHAKERLIRNENMFVACWADDGLMARLDGKVTKVLKLLPICEA